MEKFLGIGALHYASDVAIALGGGQSSGFTKSLMPPAAGINVRQIIGTVTVDGVACDLSDQVTDDWGQHPAPATPAPIEKSNDMLIARPTTPGTYLFVSGAGVMVLADHESVSALVNAGIPEATLSDADFNRLKALAS